MVGCRSRRVRTFGRSSPFFGRPRLRLGGVGGFLLRGRLLTGLDGRRVAREVAHQPVVVRLPDQRFVHALGQLRVGELGKGAREDRLARHLELPLPAAEPAQGHIGGQPVQQCARRRQVVDCLGHEGPRHRRAVLGRPPRRPEVPGNQALDTDDLQGLHQLLLFFGQWTQRLLQPREQRTLDRLPVGGERGAQGIHGLLTAPTSYCILTARDNVKLRIDGRWGPDAPVHGAIRRAQGGTAVAWVSLPGQPPDPPDSVWEDHLPLLPRPWTPGTVPTTTGHARTAGKPSG